MSSCFASLFYLALPGSCLARFAHFLAGLCSPSFFCSLLPSLFIPLPCLSQSQTQSLRKLAPCPPALVVKQIWTASIGGKLSQILAATAAAVAAAAAAAALEALETHFETASEEMLWPTEGPVASTAGRTASPPAADGDGVQARVRGRSSHCSRVSRHFSPPPKPKTLASISIPRFSLRVDGAPAPARTGRTLNPQLGRDL